MILVTGSDSAIIAGRKAQLLAWKREFGAATRTIYARKTQTVEGSAIEPIAMELGGWYGTTGAERLGGSYAAKWRRVDGNWVIVAEVFVTLTAG